MLAGGAFAAAAPPLWARRSRSQALVFAVVSALAWSASARRSSGTSRQRRQPATQPIGVEAIEGAEAPVIEEVAPARGMVKIGGELWSARPTTPPR